MLPSTNPVSEGSTSCPVVFCMRRDWRDSWGLGYINVQEFTWWFLGFLGFSMTPTFKLWQWICIDILYIYICNIAIINTPNDPGCYSKKDPSPWFHRSGFFFCETTYLVQDILFISGNSIQKLIRMSHDWSHWRWKNQVSALALGR